MTDINKEIEKIVEKKLEEINRSGDENQVDILWQYMNELNERVQCLEKQKEDKMTYIDEKLIDNYLSEGYDRERDDKATEIENEEDTLYECVNCGGKFSEDDIDTENNEWLCRNCEVAKEELK